MSVAAKRFQFLDNETNVPTNNFMSSNSSSILNSATSDMLEVTSTLSAMIEGNKMEDIGSILADVAESATLGVSRITKDFFSDENDFSGIASATKDLMTDRMFQGNNNAKSAYRQLGPTCRQNILNTRSNCRNSSPYASYNGRTRNTRQGNCGVDSFSNMINQLSGGSYSPNMVDRCAMQKMVTGVADRGYEIGLPGVFPALTKQISSQSILTNAAVGLLGKVVSRNDMFAVMDIANSVVGKNIKSLNPNVSQQVMGGFSIPSEVRERDLTGFYDDFDDSLLSLDPDWLSYNAPTGRMLSVSNLDSNNDDTRRMFESKSYSQSPTYNDTGIVDSISNAGYALAGLAMKVVDPVVSLAKDFGDFLSGDQETDSSYSYTHFV